MAGVRLILQELLKQSLVFLLLPFIVELYVFPGFNSTLYSCRSCSLFAGVLPLKHLIFYSVLELRELLQKLDGLVDLCLELDVCIDSLRIKVGLLLLVEAT